MNGLLDSLFQLLNILLVLLPDWFDIVLVDEDGALGAWVEKPNQSGDLQYVVEWNERKDEPSELICDSEYTEHYPISEPLFVVISAFRLESVETHETWICHSNQVSDDCGANAEHDEEHESH